VCLAANDDTNKRRKWQASAVIDVPIRNTDTSSGQSGLAISIAL
jgi:hypothetical protein